MSGKPHRSMLEKWSPTLATFLQRAHESAPLLSLHAAAIALRCFVAMSVYSGAQSPPMYGDFEAQRHWMEITTQLPITQWYFHDGDYWPLDYPPLTAYHSWMLGQLGTLFDPHWFALHSSRGLETIRLKVFMRSSVIISECAIFIPAAAMICHQQMRKPYNAGESMRIFTIALTALLIQPVLLLIDHGHFQYNSVMLGFSMAAVAALLADRHLTASALFVIALGFKQMALFYAPAIAAYLAGGCLVPRFQPLRLLAIAGTTLLCVALLYAPVLLGTWYNPSNEIPLPSVQLPDTPLQAIMMTMPPGLRPYGLQVWQSLQRIFPFGRGILGDKVANVWCAINHSGFYKLKAHHTNDSLIQAAMNMTLLSILPPCFIIFLRPRKELVLLAVTTCAWGFFLCGYHVHEKSVLLPLVPMTALLAKPGGTNATTRAWIGFANVVGTWTLFHLIMKDDLQLAYFCLSGIWIALLGRPLLLEPHFVSFRDGPSRFTRCFHLSAYACIVMWHVLQHTIHPPAELPDLWIVVSMILGCGAFCMCYLWCLWTLFIESGLLKEMAAKNVCSSVVGGWLIIRSS